MRGNEKIFSSDMRITINHENKCDPSKIENQSVTFRRKKERTSFQIGWTRIDLTIVDDNTFECELEVADVNFLMQYKDQPLEMQKLIRKFILNQICLSKLVAHAF